MSAETRRIRIGRKGVVGVQGHSTEAKVMSSAGMLVAWLDREIDEAQAELGAELSEFDRLFQETGSLEEPDGHP